MTHDPSSQPHAAAITQLEWFNLSTYAARTFVALCGLGSGTAKEVSEIAEVPRTRVYDAVDELHDRGLVDIRESSPQQFLAVSEETIGRKLESDTAHRLSILTTALSQIEPVDRAVEQRGIWTVDSAEAIRDRLLEFVAEADEKIVYLAADRFYSTTLLEGLSTAADRGVSITVAPGNHDGGVADLWDDRAGVDILPQSGGLLGDADRGEAVGVCHGHTWPAPELLSTDVLCLAHEHPTVKLQDSVGGYRTEKAWLRGRLDREVMAAGVDADPDAIAWSDPELIVVPAFNDRSGGTWVNIESEGFLSPLLPEGLVDADCYLLDGTRLGAYQSV